MTSKAIQLKGPGAESIRLVDREIETPGPGQALIEIEGSCLNYHDAVVVWGLIPGMRYPRIPLSDGCGTVLELGAGVEGVNVGDRVTPNFYPRWLDGPPRAEVKTPIWGEGVDGFCARHAVVDADSLVRAPTNLTLAEGGTLACAALTAWSAIVTNGRVGPGKTVVVEGTGGVSLFALQFAKAHGARVIATSSSGEKLERVRDLGADEGINYRETPTWSSRVVELTDGQGADIVCDVGGPGSLEQAMLATRMDGHVSVVGVLGGFGNAEIPVTIAMTRNITMQGVTVGSRKDFDRMNRFLETRDIHPIVSDTFPMSDLGAAVKHLEEGRHFGKIAIATA